MPKKYSIENYDKNLCLKMNETLWYIVLFLLRPYLVSVMSFFNREDRSAIINMVYSDKMALWWSILAGVPAVIVIVALKKKKPDASPAARMLWHRGRELLAASAIFGVAIVFVPVWIGTVYQVSLAGWIQLALNLGVVAVLYSSSYIRDCFSDYPVEADADADGSGSS